MDINLKKYIKNLLEKLPDVCADRDLMEHVPNIFKSLSTIHRMRRRNEIPNHFQVGKFFFYYKEDVTDWIISKYMRRDVETKSSASNKSSTKTKAVVNG